MVFGRKRALSFTYRARGGRAFGPAQAAALSVLAALAAIAFAAALKPGGYRHRSDFALAFLLGLFFLLLLVASILLLGRHLHSSRSATYLAMTVGFVLLLGVAGARSWVAQTGASRGRADGRVHAQQTFRRWALQAVPLIVLYQAALAAAGPVARPSASKRVTARHVPPAELARLHLSRLEPRIRRLIANAPINVRPFASLLMRAMALAGAAERRYAALPQNANGYAPPTRPESRALLKQGSFLLRRSEQAIVAFTIYVNGAGSQLFNR